MVKELIKTMNKKVKNEKMSTKLIGLHWIFSTQLNFIPIFINLIVFHIFLIKKTQFLPVFAP